jgi:hypothetical protein
MRDEHGHADTCPRRGGEAVEGMIPRDRGSGIRGRNDRRARKYGSSEATDSPYFAAMHIGGGTDVQASAKAHT